MYVYKAKWRDRYNLRWFTNEIVLQLLSQKMLCDLLELFILPRHVTNVFMRDESFWDNEYCDVLNIWCFSAAFWATNTSEDLILSCTLRIDFVILYVVQRRIQPRHRWKNKAINLTISSEISTQDVRKRLVVAYSTFLVLHSFIHL